MFPTLCEVTGPKTAQEPSRRRRQHRPLLQNKPGPRTKDGFIFGTARKVMVRNKKYSLVANQEEPEPHSLAKGFL
ncbi:MAG: hypothetical protein CM1200mP29_16990 [Verrucomicrobiota bacterium]|nr:MAG: hypothetical protein CM1200mP29_16990 [Verrucomicrobiota bacterium]